MSVATARFAVTTALIGLALTSCAGAPPTTSTASSAPARRPSTPSSSSSSASATPTLAASAPRPPQGLSWHRVAATSSLESVQTQQGRYGLLWMDPTRVKFRFVPGTKWPEGSPVSAADRNPSTWVPTMLAAFDGAFKLSDHVGGYWYRGHTVATLKPGLAAFDISTDGTLSVGVWGRDLTLTSSTAVVRENLRPVVDRGVSLAHPGDSVNAWGRVLGNNPAVNRSALAVLSDGGLVFLAGHQVTAAQVGRELVSLGAREAIMLDMNPMWPTGYVYTHRGSQVSGKRIAGWIVRSPSIYLERFTKDFVVVEPRT